MDKIRRTKIKPKKRSTLFLKISVVVLLCIVMLALGVVCAELILGLL